MSLREGGREACGPSSLEPARPLSRDAEQFELNAQRKLSDEELLENRYAWLDHVRPRVAQMEAALRRVKAEIEIVEEDAEEILERLFAEEAGNHESPRVLVEKEKAA